MRPCAPPGADLTGNAIEIREKGSAGPPAPVAARGVRSDGVTISPASCGWVEETTADVQTAVAPVAGRLRRLDRRGMDLRRHDSLPRLHCRPGGRPEGD